MQNESRGKCSDADIDRFGESSSEDDDKDDEQDEAEFQRQAELQRARQQQEGRRRSHKVGDTLDESVNWIPPVHPKTPQQYAEIKSSLAQSIVFSSLPPANVEQVVNAFKGPQAVPARGVVITQGKEVASGEGALFIVERGVLDVYKAAPGASQPGDVVATYNARGQIFGELALLYNCPRAATVVARTDSLLWSIDRDTFTNLVRKAHMETRQRHERFLATVDLMKGLTNDERAKIADVLRVRTCERGEAIFRQGEQGKEFFLLEKGRAVASVPGHGVVKEYGPGEYFGELALLHGAPRAADVYADATPTVLAVLDVSAFRRLLGPLDSLLAHKAKGYSPINAPSPTQMAGAAGQGGASDGSFLERMLNALCVCQTMHRAPDKSQV